MWVKFTGTRFELKEPLQTEAHQVFQGSGEVVSETKIDNKDGTFDYVYNFRPLLLDLREAPDEMSIPKQKIKRHLASTVSMSQELRMNIEDLWRDLGGLGDKETFYKARMKRFITQIQAEREIAR